MVNTIKTIFVNIASNLMWDTIKYIFKIGLIPIVIMLLKALFEKKTLTIIILTVIVLILIVLLILSHNKHGKIVYPNFKFDYFFTKNRYQLFFYSRSNISYLREDFLVSNKNNLTAKKLGKFKWSGSSYKNPKLILNSNNHSLSITKGERWDIFEINFSYPLQRKEKTNYKLVIDLMDKNHTMENYLGVAIEIPTDILILEVIFPIEYNIKVKYIIYYNSVQNKIYETKDAVDYDILGKYKVYRFITKKPRLFYKYSIEWEFIA